MVKALAATVLTAAGFAVVACGSGTTKAGALTFTGSTTTTLAHVKTGTSVRCGGVGVYVPASGGAAGNGDGPSSSASLYVQRLASGSVRISCRLS